MIAELALALISLTSNPTDEWKDAPVEVQIPPLHMGEDTWSEVIVESPEQVIRRVFPDEYESAAVRVAKCESGLREDARNGQYWGLFQIGVRVHAGRLREIGLSPEELLSASGNAEAALDLFVRSNRTWQPWSCKP